MLKFLAAIALVALLAVSFLSMPPASAGGAPLNFERESYLPGEVAVAQTAFGRGCCGRGWIEHGPYHAYILQTVEGRAVGERIAVGEVSIDEEEYRANGQTFTRLVARVEFVVPDVPFGNYWLGHCNEGCATELGDVTSGSFFVGSVGSGAPHAVAVSPRFAG